MSKHDSLIEELCNDERYEIRPDGTIWIKFKKGTKQTGLAKNSQGYRFVSYRNTELRVHRVVYRKFHGPLKDGLLIDHIDGDVGNNSANNLQQISYKANTRKGKAAKITPAIAAYIRKAYEAGEFTQKALGAKFGITQSEVSRITTEGVWNNG